MDLMTIDAQIVEIEALFWSCSFVSYLRVEEATGLDFASIIALKPQIETHMREGDDHLRLTSLEHGFFLDT